MNGERKKHKDITGQRFGKLVAVECVGQVSQKDKHALWLCKCDCGNTKFVSSGHLKNGGTISCGCFNHGKSDGRLYNIWSHMKSRCLNENDNAFLYYGGRGIGVCEQWKTDFQSFHKWALESGYSEELTLDRIDVDGDYCPENCRWATKKEQMLNTRRNRKITYNGETLTVNEWAERIGIKQNTLLYRLRRGWSVEKALTKRI